jgi:hypothetical protein
MIYMKRTISAKDMLHMQYINISCACVAACVSACSHRKTVRQVALNFFNKIKTMYILQQLACICSDNLVISLFRRLSEPLYFRQTVIICFYWHNFKLHISFQRDVLSLRKQQIYDGDHTTIYIDFRNFIDMISHAISSLALSILMYIDSCSATCPTHELN